MRAIAISIVLSLSSCCTILAQESTFDPAGWLPVTATHAVSNSVASSELTPIRRICPEEVEQDSIRMLRFSTNSFAVIFAYTEAGAKKMLAFSREHAGHEGAIQVGKFEFRYTMSSLELKPPGWTEEGYLKHRGDKFVGVSEDEAKEIVEGLKRK